MKRVWIGAVFLVTLLAVALTVMHIMDRQLGKISNTLEQAAAALSWEAAADLATKAERDWQSKKKLITALTDHNAVNGIEELFARLEVCRRYQEKSEHSALCAQLSKAVHALEENHRLAWYNLL